MKKIILLFVIFMLSLNTVFACSCIAPSSPAEEMQKAAAVFQGKVIALDTQRDIDQGEVIEVTFEVSKVWKGDIQREHQVMTSASSASCGVTFEQEEEYLVYTTWENEDQVTLCSRTARVSDASEDIPLLGEGRAVEAQQDNPPVATSEEKSSMRTLMVVLIVLTGLAAIVFFLKKKK